MLHSFPEHTESLHDKYKVVMSCDAYTQPYESNTFLHRKSNNHIAHGVTDRSRFTRFTSSVLYL